MLQSRKILPVSMAYFLSLPSIKWNPCCIPGIRGEHNLKEKNWTSAPKPTFLSSEFTLSQFYIQVLQAFFPPLLTKTISESQISLIIYSKSEILVGLAMKVISLNFYWVYMHFSKNDLVFSLSVCKHTSVLQKFTQQKAMWSLLLAGILF